MPARNIEEFKASLQADHLQYLQKMVSDFQLPDESQALRILIDFAIADADPNFIFARENMRCRHCVI